MRPTRPKTPRKGIGRLKSCIKDPIEVFCRIRPLDDELDQVCIRPKDEKTVVLIPPDASQNARTIREVHYSFKYVFNDETTQKELFDHVCLPLVQDLLQGSNGLLFTYGITSSGKTYTMTGSPQDGGLLPRSLDVIFNSIKDYQAPKFIFKPDKLNGFDVQSTAEALLDQQKGLGLYNRNAKFSNKKEAIGDWCSSSRVADQTVVEDIIPDMNYAVFVSYVEIYNNYIYDLLDETPIDPKRITKNINSKMLREDASHNMYVFGVIETEVKTVEEALELFRNGQLRRRVSHTALNTESSRSHSVFTIRVAQAPLDHQGAEVLTDKDKVTISQLSLVDLAGSERPVRTKNTGSKLREAGNINASLMALRTCIEALRDSQNQAANKLVPYRESKLTHLFKTFFEGEGKIRMVVCVNPRADYFEETIHVMRFAEMTQDVLIQRPAPVSTPTILGLKPGRGNIYREVKKKAKELNVPVSELLPPTVYSLGPDFPLLIFNISDDESGYVNLIEFLNNRIARRNTCYQDIMRRQEEFRKNLMAVDQENVQLKQEYTIVRMDLDGREQQVRSLERKVASLEETVDTLTKQNQDYKKQAERASAEVIDRDRVIVEQSRKMDRMNAQYQERMASDKDRWRRTMERRWAEKQAEMERKQMSADEKIRMLREIINAEDEWEYFDVNPPPNVPSSTATSSDVSSIPQTRIKRVSQAEVGVESRFTKARSAVDIIHDNNLPSSQYTGPSSRNRIDSVFFKENQPPTVSSEGSRGIVVANPRHRRSTSTGNKWIEHKPIGNLDLNTCLQTAMKKKKSVSKLEVKDVIRSDVSNYVLEHQEQDSQGEMETQLYKADVIPSAGGGAQVIFNDVETLRQKSPPQSYNLRKRSSDNLPLREIEERCTVSVECHGLPPKKKK